MEEYCRGRTFCQDVGNEYYATAVGQDIFGIYAYISRMFKQNKKTVLMFQEKNQGNFREKIVYFNSKYYFPIEDFSKYTIQDNNTLDLLTETFFRLLMILEEMLVQVVDDSKHNSNCNMKIIQKKHATCRFAILLLEPNAIKLYR